MAEGDIYLIRDLDLRTGQEIDYLKIGRTKPNESDDRIAKHQTGNPRLITKKWDGVVPNDAAIEGHLHHYFSTDRVRGEWFWINDDKLKNEVIPMVEKLIKEFSQRNFTVSTIKHAHHNFTMDRKGSDSFRHFNAGSRETIVASQKKWVKY